MQQHECPHCGELIDLKDADITLVEAAQDINLTATCRECDGRVNVWARISSLKTL